MLARLLDPFSINNLFIDKSLTSYEVSRRLFVTLSNCFFNKLVAEQHRKVLSTLLTLVFANFAFALCIHSIVHALILLAWSQSYWCMLSYPCNACHDSIYLLQSCVNVVFKLVCGLPSLSSFDQDNNPFCSHVAFGWFISFAMRFIFFSCAMKAYWSWDRHGVLTLVK